MVESMHKAPRGASTPRGSTDTGGLHMPKYTCEHCGAGFTSYNPRPKFCSFKCKGAAQEAVFDLPEATRLYMAGWSQSEVARHFGLRQQTLQKAFRRHGIQSRANTPRIRQGAEHPSWKGDDVGYAALHKRVETARGTPKACSVCGATDPDRVYDWANLTGNYHDAQDYARMCRSCHSAFDGKVNNIKRMRGRAANE